MVYLNESLKWMNSILEMGRDSLVRPVNELPHFADDPQTQFPFLHKALWADSDLSELDTYIRHYNKIVRLLNQANLTEIRNGLDHARDEKNFPDNDKMLGCIARIREAFELSDINRLIPKIYWLKRSSENSFGLFENEYVDYEDKSTIVLRPSVIIGFIEKNKKDPMMIAPVNFLGKANSLIIFRLENKNEYSRYWFGYPIRNRVKKKDSENSCLM